MGDKTIESLLADEAKPLVGKYRRLIYLSRESQICKNDDGKWKKRESVQVPPQAEIPHQFVPPSESAIRASLQMGKFRPAGLDGPPATSISFSLASFRRHTVGDPRGTKRPAEEQPLGQPQTKAVCGLDYGKEKVEAAVNNFSESDHMELSRLVESLHNLADRLTRVSPSRSKSLFLGQVPQLKRGLISSG